MVSAPTISLDSSLVQPYLTAREKTKISNKLPALFKLNYRYILKPGTFDIEAGVSYLLFADALPKESLGLGYSFEDKIRFELKESYGGYSKFRTGISCTVLIAKRWKLSVQSDQFSGMLLQNGKTQGAFVSLSAYF